MSSVARVTSVRVSDLVALTKPSITLFALITAAGGVALASLLFGQLVHAVNSFARV